MKKQKPFREVVVCCRIMSIDWDQIAPGIGVFAGEPQIILDGFLLQIRKPEKGAKGRQLFIKVADHM